MSYSIPSVLTVAGSDSSGGAGIQADIKTVESMGLYAQSVITALTAQNTLGVYGVFDVAPDFVRAQIDAVFGDIRPHAVKVGMVSSADIVSAIAQGLSEHTAPNVVLDPVMVSTSGSRLISQEAKNALVRDLFPLSTLITPNIPEAEVLCGMSIETPQDMESAAQILSGMTPGAVLVKGGHGATDADDLLYLEGLCHWLKGRRVETKNTHGTGCTLSSAIACGLASGRGVLDAVSRAKDYVSGALRADFVMGKGNGSLDHMWAHREVFESLEA